MVLFRLTATCWCFVSDGWCVSDCAVWEEWRERASGQRHCGIYGALHFTTPTQPAQYYCTGCCDTDDIHFNFRLQRRKLCYTGIHYCINLLMGQYKLHWKSLWWSGPHQSSGIRSEGEGDFTYHKTCSCLCCICFHGGRWRNDLYRIFLLNHLILLLPLKILYFCKPAFHLFCLTDETIHPFNSWELKRVEKLFGNTSSSSITWGELQCYSSKCHKTHNKPNKTKWQIE